MPLNAFDIVILILLVYAFIRGFSRGLFLVVAGLIAILAGAYFAINYSHNLEYILRDTIIEMNDQGYRITAFIITFLVIVLLVITLGKILTKLADITALGLMNKILGGIFSVAKSALILSVLFTFFSKINNTFPFINEETLDNSTFYHPIKEIAPALFPSVIKKDKDGRTKFEIPV